jgi:hypothetical protein
VKHEQIVPPALLDIDRESRQPLWKSWAATDEQASATATGGETDHTSATKPDWTSKRAK